MFVITVSPVRKVFGKEEISYFSATPIKPGNIISVPLRKGEALALVMACLKAEDYKAELKSSDFALRKIGEIKTNQFFLEEWMDAVKKFSEYFAISEGESLASLLPKIVLENIENLDNGRQTIDNSKNGESKLEAVQLNYKERTTHYKSIVREEFAKKKSVFLCLSTNEEVELARENFGKGIEKYIFIFQASMKKEEFLENYKKMLETSHPVLVVASAKWLFLIRKGVWGKIILDNEQSGSYRNVSRPFVDFKKFAYIFAEGAGVDLVVGDTSLSVESINNYKIRQPYEFQRLNFRSLTSAKIKMVDKGTLGKGIISPELIKLIQEAKEKNKNIFIYSTRKGLSSVTVCRDCGTEVLCNNCASPVVLYSRAGKKDLTENIFRCHQCGESRAAVEVCKECGSWRLAPLGAGVERVAEDVRNQFGETQIFEINKEATSTSLRARKVAEKFYKTPGAVLIGTEMALGYLRERVDFASIVSIGSLFSIPDFHIREKVFHTILEIRSLASEKFLMQVRNTELATVTLGLSGNILDFYKREIKEREEMAYPPFSVFIKITLRGNKVLVKKEMSKLEQILEKYNHSVFPSISERRGTIYAENCVVKIKKEEWPNQDLLNILLSLPPIFEIKVDPDNLL